MFSFSRSKAWGLFFCRTVCCYAHSFFSSPSFPNSACSAKKDSTEQTYALVCCHHHKAAINIPVCKYSLFSYGNLAFVYAIVSVFIFFHLSCSKHCPGGVNSSLRRKIREKEEVFTCAYHMNNMNLFASSKITEQSCLTIWTFKHFFKIKLI